MSEKKRNSKRTESVHSLSGNVATAKKNQLSVIASDLRNELEIFRALRDWASEREQAIIAAAGGASNE